MSTLSLPSDDLPPAQMTNLDEMLLRQLEEAISKRLYEGCDGVTQSLLTTCEWSVTINASILTLVISSPVIATHWRALNYILPLGNQLGKFSGSAIIRVCPPLGAGEPVEIQVSEITAYRDSL
ncbi:hypothetical protein K9N68_26670 [Kovacikia minuta CCNUW1]|uniref:hypothetical protein n=1 Tax=Kovacikia minuta TaxID=2931930 RepID=UPI001CCB64F7|nr:hypothetical protein [Kovacikia minuta]UBF25176.1 hypothetical protein K9N68_26670 [Kovacikia minuta CCNUW1]